MNRDSFKVLGSYIGLALAAVLSTACPPWFQSPEGRPEPDPYAAWSHVNLSPGQDLAAAIEGAGDHSVISLGAGIFTLAGHGPYDYGALIQDKDGLVVRGQGRGATIVKLPADLDFGFYLGSDVSGLVLEDFAIEGTLPLEINTHAFGNYTGPGYSENVRGIRIRDLRISHVAVGISIATWSEGFYDDVEISRNIITDLHGTESGSGYGIHVDNPTNISIRRNFVKRSTRHGIYIGRAAAGANVVVDSNLIYAHDQFESNPNTAASALVCARSSDVRLSFNTVLDSRLYSLSVEPDEAFGWPTDDVHLVGNQILGAWKGGIWVYTGGAHPALGNSVVQRPDAGFWTDYRVEFQYGSSLQCPNPRWEDEDLEYDFIARWGDAVFVLREGVLDRLRPFASESEADWSYDSSALDFSGARYLCAGPAPEGSSAGLLYVGLPGGGFATLDPEDLALLSDDSGGVELLGLHTTAPSPSWKTDGVTEYRLDVWLDARAFEGRSLFLAEWQLLVPEGLSLARACLPRDPSETYTAVDGRRVPPGDLFAGYAMDAEENRMGDAILVTSDGLRRVGVSVRQTALVFEGPRGTCGLLGSYWFRVEPGTAPGAIRFGFDQCAVADTELTTYTLHNGITERHQEIEVASE